MVHMTRVWTYVLLSCSKVVITRRGVAAHYDWGRTVARQANRIVKIL